MGTSTDGQINFGILFDEGFRFPWDATEEDDDCGGDIEKWWRKVNGYVPLYEPFTPAGEYAPGWTKDDPRFTEYFAHRRKWEQANPIPVELVNYCSGNCQMYMIAAVGLGASNRRGYPKEITPDLFVDTVEIAAGLVAFCEKWGIDRSECPDGNTHPRWWLSSYWG